MTPFANGLRGFALKILAAKAGEAVDSARPIRGLHESAPLHRFATRTTPPPG